MSSSAATKPTVSVCIPTYNGAAHLEEALACVTAQTFSDFEVVIVDDCSVDGTVAIAERYVANEPRARLIRNKVRAGSSGRNANRCLEESSGEWVKFLFQDDLMTPDCLEKMLRAGDRGPLVISHHDYVFAPETDDEVRQYYETLPTVGEVLPVDYAPADAVCAAIMRHLWVNFVGPTSASLIHRQCFATYGRFHGTNIYFPDLELWMRVGTNAGIAIARERLTSFRVHGATTSARIRHDPLREVRGSLDGIIVMRSIDQAPEYRRLREFARRCDPPFDAAAQMWDALADVRWAAMEASYRQRDRRLIKELNAVCKRDPTFRALMSEFESRRPLWTRLKEFVKARV